MIETYTIKRIHPENISPAETHNYRRLTRAQGVVVALLREIGEITVDKRINPPSPANRYKGPIRLPEGYVWKTNSPYTMPRVNTLPPMVDDGILRVKKNRKHDVVLGLA